jgi:thiol-disulfide isomerase/thioredoxin
MKKNIITLIVVLVLISIAIFLMSTGNKNVSPNLEGQEEVSEPQTFEDSSSSLSEFSQEAFQEAKDEGKNVFVYFYAYWCPTCTAEMATAIAPAFEAWEGEEVVGFFANFDNKADEAEKALAKELQVYSRHQKVYYKGNEVLEITAPTAWSMSQHLEQLNSYFGI